VEEVTMRTWKAAGRAVAMGALWTALWAGLQSEYELVRYGALVPRGPILLVGAVAVFLGGFAVTFEPRRRPDRNRSA
jgi:hypothetical protein